MPEFFRTGPDLMPQPLLARNDSGVGGGVRSPRLLDGNVNETVERARPFPEILDDGIAGLFAKHTELFMGDERGEVPQMRLRQVLRAMHPDLGRDAINKFILSIVNQREQLVPQKRENGVSVFSDAQLLAGAIIFEISLHPYRDDPERGKYDVFTQRAIAITAEGSNVREVLERSLTPEQVVRSEFMPREFQGPRAQYDPAGETLSTASNSWEGYEGEQEPAEDVPDGSTGEEDPGTFLPYEQRVHIQSVESARRSAVVFTRTPVESSPTDEISKVPDIDRDIITHYFNRFDAKNLALLLRRLRKQPWQAELHTKTPEARAFLQAIGLMGSYANDFLSSFNPDFEVMINDELRVHLAGALTLFERYKELNEGTKATLDKVFPWAASRVRRRERNS